MKASDRIINEILNKRGITDEDEIREFMSDKPQKTYDPFLLLNMKEGVDLLLSEIKKGTKICIYGDYDADGVTSVCILSNALRMLTDNFTYYIPSRFEEGYGLNKAAIKKIKDQGTGLIITVDCGSVSYDEVEYAKELGIRMIVTDHHSIDDIKADCILINPKQEGCTYPFKELAGCGIAFKMVQAIRKRENLPKSVVTEVLDLAAVGTVGDIVSLRDENRTIVKYGLNKINTGNRRALRCLKDRISLNVVTSENIAFGIAPHINAAGRLSHASEAAELFLTDDYEVMCEKTEKLVQLNAERKRLQEEAYRRCVSMISGTENFIVLRVDGIHEGIAGIVAGKIKENYDRPVIILTVSGEGFLKGTGRSVQSVDIYETLKRHDELFERFGGHRSACGLLMKEEKLEELRTAMNEEIDEMLAADPDLYKQNVIWDCEISPEDITMELADSLNKLEPFGQDNPRPVLLMKNVGITDVKLMGADETHARFNAVSQSGYTAECVLFQRAQELKNLLFSNGKVDITGTINIKKWNGRKYPQFITEEVYPCR